MLLLLCTYHKKGHDFLLLPPTNKQLIAAATVVMLRISLPPNVVGLDGVPFEVVYSNHYLNN